MFGVVEFHKNSRMIVPMCWLKGEFCYWPKAEELAEKMGNLKEGWPSYKVSFKSLNCTFKEASESLQNFPAVPTFSKTPGVQLSQNSSFKDPDHSEVVAGGSGVSSKMFGVVEFHKNSRMIVPMCWLKGEFCYWPKVEELAEKMGNLKEGWPSYKVSFKSLNCTFEEARQSLQNYTAVPTSSKTPGVQTSQNSSFIEATTESFAGGSRVLLDDSVSENEDSVLEGIEEGVSGLNISEELQSGKVPLLQNMDDLKSLEEALSKDPELRERLCEKISQMEDFGEEVRGKLRKLMCDELAKEFTWGGTKDKDNMELKKKFESLTIKSLLIDAVKRKPHFSHREDKDFQSVISGWLLSAPYRCHKRRNK